MVRVFVAVGSNIEPARNIREGLDRLNQIVPILDSSPFYETEPIGRPEQDNYWNGVIVLDLPDDTDPVQFQFETLRGVEAAQGRVRTKDKYAARTLDLDVILWGDQEIDRNGMRVPDPDIPRRPFLIRCLDDLGTAVPGASTGPRADPELRQVRAPWP